MKSLRVSVAMCTYNGSSYLSEQLASLARQETLPAELVVVDDASTDETWSILMNFQSEAAFPVHLHRNPENLGSTRSFERVLSLVSGDVVALCDQDDVWRADKVSVMTRAFEGDAGIGMWFSDLRLVDESGKAVGLTAWQTSQIAFPPEARVGLEGIAAVDRLLSRALVVGAGAAFRARLLPLILPFPNVVRGTEPGDPIHDAWAALVAASVARLVPDPRTLVDYRQHGGQQIGLASISGGRNPAESDLPLDIIFRIRLRRQGMLLERLTSQAAVFPPHAGLLERLQSELTHTLARQSLPAGPARWVHVFREARTGRYSRWSAGWRSIVKDLIGGPRVPLDS